MRALKGLSSDSPLADPSSILILDPCERSRSRLAAILAPFGALLPWRSLGRPRRRGRGEPDLALVSLEWPEGEGVAIIRRLRQVARRRDLPVVAIADGADMPARLCLEAGIHDRLLRPIDRSEALMRVRLALRVAQYSSILLESEGFAPAPAFHRLNRRPRRRPPEKFAA